MSTDSELYAFICTVVKDVFDPKATKYDVFQSRLKNSKYCHLFVDTPIKTPSPVVTPSSPVITKPVDNDAVSTTSDTMSVSPIDIVKNKKSHVTNVSNVVTDAESVVSRKSRKSDEKVVSRKSRKTDETKSVSMSEFDDCSSVNTFSLNDGDSVTTKQSNNAVYIYFCKKTRPHIESILKETSPNFNNLSGTEKYTIIKQKLKEMYGNLTKEQKERLRYEL